MLHTPLLPPAPQAVASAPAPGVSKASWFCHSYRCYPYMRACECGFRYVRVCTLGWRNVHTWVADQTSAGKNAAIVIFISPRSVSLRTARGVEACAVRRRSPMVCIHGGHGHGLTSRNTLFPSLRNMITRYHICMYTDTAQRVVPSRWQMPSPPPMGWRLTRGYCLHTGPPPACRFVR